MDGLPPAGPRRCSSRCAPASFGTPRQVHADLGFVVPTRPPSDRMLDPALGAGALLDMGIYPLTFAHLMLGPSAERSPPATSREAGIDLDVAIAGALRRAARSSALTTSMTVLVARAPPRSPPTRGRSTLPARLPPPDVRRVDAARRRRRRERIEPPTPVLGTGLGNEAARGAALPARRADREPAGAARPDPRADAADGRRPRASSGCATPPTTR